MLIPYDQSHISQAIMERMHKYQYDLVFEQLAFPAGFYNELSSRTKVTLMTSFKTPP